MQGVQKWHKKNTRKTGPLAGCAMLCLPQGHSPTVVQDIGGAALVKAFPPHLWSLPSPTVSSASRHSNHSLVLCIALVLAVYLVSSFLVAPLAQICAPVALSPLLPSSATSCAASMLGLAIWIPTQHPAQCDSNVPLVIGRGAPFHSVTWHSHGTIVGTCSGGGGPHRGRLSCSAPHCWRPLALSPWHQWGNEKLGAGTILTCVVARDASLEKRGAVFDAQTGYPSRR